MLVRTGTVWLAFEDGVYEGYWEAEPENPAAMLEELPPTADAWSALDWARARSAKILIRPRYDPAHYYWAGQGPPPQSDEDEFELLDESRA
jgi:hypothetical protein